jgi:alpha-ribazole phosphatase
MTKIILVRHGLTVWNHELRYQGHADVPLAEEGHRQAEKLAKRLAKENLSAVYASDLGRASQTAQAVANQHQLPVTLLPALRERAYGAVLEVVKNHPGESVAVVSHGGTIRTLLCAVLDLDLNKLWQIKQDNTAVNILEFYDTKALVSLVNDTHHLHEG